VTEPEDLRPQSSEEAAQIIRDDPALAEATKTSGEDAATDDDARTADTAASGETRD
jgi:hypothetical protein